MSSSVLTAEIAALRQLVRELVDVADDLLAWNAGGGDEAAHRARLRAACDRADRLIGRKP